MADLPVEARDPGIAPDGVDVLAARNDSEGRSEKRPTALEVAVTAGFRLLYVLVVMEVSSRRILHCNVPASDHDWHYRLAPKDEPAWTLQQFREVVASDHTYRILIHDRDSIINASLQLKKRDQSTKEKRSAAVSLRGEIWCSR